MIDVILSGANGRMGQVLQTLIAQQSEMQVVAGIDREAFEADFPTYQSIEACQETADVVIDFSHYSAVPAVLTYCAAKKMPVVIATTGLPDAVKEQLVQTSQQTAVFFSANMSLGINLLAKAIREITPVLEDEFNIEIVEKHHNQKKDAPSGTALLLADAVNDAVVEKKTYIYGRHGNDLENPLSELGIHAVRGGTIPGEHTVIYAGPDEVIELNHLALSRNIFASGAVKAAKYVSQKAPGLYDMEQLIDEK
ncbi:4-hydroxy-tetrahydrodipicolinate reductase [Enterococcus pseudoavium]|uniref:4-hydroxy-tetrahydrodipicolinate reductase n=1 Tax=Enterococcus pseudoavium TaxID=44007 RepID=A0AAE4I0D1_9ENTE|nr:4-hydroxy-tetrahydrodipicolinate reductase [Enterococcus pseudoavium]MDT2735897.1 4-hydroxy-tetrahydrodipicolinate reductase [Enterococcus pseudoavium]MDT2754449.1 4-hydroxy-tetrahydrodipicolinate reductase [Enterococcus pseudoavium]MDT2769495.1 4-hydroxy-tetrahydrodipicolinate reductase [Enterococcus pseudoavium]REC31016.1 4-hydroxy-tetrahydrodipicolinate reductase [Enterococcus pseudoavium]